MSGECDPILVADDDGVILDGGEPESDDRERRVAERTRCEHCGHEFDVGDTRGSFDGTRARYVCPNCGRGTEGPPPGGRRC